MSNQLFLDIETVPTTAALLDASLAAGCEIDNLVDETIKKLSLSALTARVLCLGYAFNGADQINCLSGDEIQIVTKFWELAGNSSLFIGYNVLDFDLRFLWQRSIILGIKPSREIPFMRFRQAPVFDVMQEWSKWGRDNVSMDTLARVLGVPSSKAGGMDGSKVYPYFCEGRLNEIYDYCRADVGTVREIFWRLAPRR